MKNEDLSQELRVSELVQRCRDGEDDAATELYMRYAKQLRAIAEGGTSDSMAARVDPEGIVQSVFRTFFRRVNQGQYDVSDSGELWKLLLVIALNKVRATSKSHRAAKRDVARTISLEFGEEATGEDEQALVVLEWTISEIVAALPERDRPIVLLRIEGYDIKEIADQCQRSKRSVERILQKFRARLANEIEA